MLLIRSGRTLAVTEHPITEDQQARIARSLAGQDIRVQPVEDVFGTLHLNALEPVTTAEEVAVLRAFKDATDMPLAFHQAVGRG